VNTSKRLSLATGAVTLALVAAACGSSTSSSTTTAPATTAAGTETTAAATNVSATLDASGSTFVKNFLAAAITGFTKTNPRVTINYAGGGSGKGRQDLADNIVEFAGTDGTIKAADLPTYKGGKVLYFPVVVAPITVSFNVKGLDKLQLSAATVAKIFQREITKWNDAAIAADNPGVTLPSTDITVVHRADSSGTTQNFTKFLDLAAGATNGGIWKLGTNSTVQWSADTQAAQGNSGVAQIISSTDGAIGYVDYADAVKAGLKFAAVKNSAGKYVDATLEGASAAAEGATINPDLTFSAVWASGDAAYPITAQTWIIAYANQTDKAKGEALKALLDYVLTEGQTLAPTVNYAPLPSALATQAVTQLGELVIPA